jgi:hypothetical protein
VLTDEVVNDVDVGRSRAGFFKVVRAMVAKEVAMPGGPDELPFHIPPAPVRCVQKPDDAGVFGLQPKRKMQKLAYPLRQFRKVAVIRGENHIRF